jgi:cyclophilin family peptidyl-prolyl cis-trans isomerase
MKTEVILCFLYSRELYIIHVTNDTLLIVGGDPTGTGKGGASIYGRHFEDEIHEELKHTGKLLSKENEEICDFQRTIDAKSIYY